MRNAIIPIETPNEERQKSKRSMQVQEPYPTDW